MTSRRYPPISREEAREVTQGMARALRGEPPPVGAEDDEDEYFGLVEWLEEEPEQEVMTRYQDLDDGGMDDLPF